MKELYIKLDRTEMCPPYYFIFIFKGVEAPAMPTSTASFPSGNTVRVRRVASMKNLTESQASSIGLANYYHKYGVNIAVIKNKEYKDIIL